MVNASNYLQVGETQYNSLQKAYDAITGDSGTVKVIADTTVEATLPDNPAGKTIIFDLNGHKLTYTQPLINRGTMTIMDSSPENTGRLSNPTTNASTVANYNILNIQNANLSGTYRTVSNYAGSSALTVSNSTIESSGSGTAIYTYTNSKTSTTPISIQINGGSIVSSKIGIQTANEDSYGHSCVAKTVSIVNTDITINSSNGYSYGVYMDGCTTLSYTGENGVRPAVAVTNSNSYTYGITGGTKSTLTNLDIIVNSTGGSAYGVSSNKATIDNLNVTVKNPGSSTTYGIDSSGTSTAPTTINNTNITVDGSGGSSGIRGYSGSYATITGGSITTLESRYYTSTSCSYNRNYIYGIYSNGEVSVQGTTIDAYGITQTPCYFSYGFYGSGNNNKILEGTKITEYGSGGLSAGVYSAADSGVTILGGKIKGATYGVYTANGLITTIGKNDGIIEKDSPEIIGGSYALYNDTTGYYKYYDGTLRGGIEAYKSGMVKMIADDAAIRREDQTIDEATYDTYWLVPESDVAQIVGGSRYAKLANAINDVPENGTIEILSDNYIFSTLTIPEEKKFTINIKGFNVYLGNQIINNGKVAIINNESNASTISYRYANYAIRNNANAELNLIGINLNANYGIENNGTLNLEKIHIDAGYTGIRNAGNITAQNDMSIKGTDYAIYNDGGESAISDATLSGKSIYNNSGMLTLTNCIALKTGDSVYDFITNKGTLALDSSSASLISTKRPSNNSRTIYNTGLLTISNNTVINHTVSDPDYSQSYIASAVYNDGGNVLVSNSSISLDTTSMKTYTSYDSSAAYNSTGTFVIESGTISSHAFGASYGIYNGTGTVIIGIAEPNSSPNYGRDTADVSQTIPNISAISTNNVANSNANYKVGIGVKNASGGRVEYYDGKVSGNTAAFAEEPTVTEHFYEVCTELDTSTTPNLYTAKLFWMRDGQSTCGQN